MPSGWSPSTSQLVSPGFSSSATCPRDGSGARRRAPPTAGQRRRRRRRTQLLEVVHALLDQVDLAPRHSGPRATEEDRHRHEGHRRHDAAGRARGSSAAYRLAPRGRPCRPPPSGPPRSTTIPSRNTTPDGVAASASNVTSCRCPSRPRGPVARRGTGTTAPGDRRDRVGDRLVPDTSHGVTRHASRGQRSGP